MKFVLASQSPRRKFLLKDVISKFLVQPSDINEKVLKNESPKPYVKRMAKTKAHAIWESFPQKNHLDLFVLAADTIVWKGEKIFGKPTSDTNAKNTLRSLSGSSHYVSTGFSLFSNRKQKTYLVTTAVTFRALSSADIKAYLETGEHLDKAGSYGIQGKAASFVEKINGSYTNVVGLPLAQLKEALEKDFGYDFP